MQILHDKKAFVIREYRNKKIAEHLVGLLQEKLYAVNTGSLLKTLPFVVAYTQYLLYI